MKNTDVPQEKISALADGELEPSRLDAVLASLREPEGRKDWDLYHQIGDVLRSKDMAVELSPDFAARMAAKLDAEPTILAPTVRAPKNEHTATSRRETAKRFFVPGIAAALAVFTAYLVAPQFTAGGDTQPTERFASSALASASSQVVASASPAPVLSISAPVSATSAGDVNKETVVLRDPDIDEYLLAHQRYSPSLYDTTQFVRSAAFENEPKK
jgi:sigma-E factor negative regulatory protein RseA